MGISALCDFPFRSPNRNRKWKAGSIFDVDHLSIDMVQRGPAVHMAVIVADLVLVAAYRRDKVGKIAPADLTEDGIAHFHVVRSGHRTVGTLLPRLDARRHAVAALTKTHRLPGAQACDIGGLACQHRFDRTLLFAHVSSYV